MGLVLGAALVERGCRVRLWGPFEKEIAPLRATRRSPRLSVEDFSLPDEVMVTADDREIFADLKENDLILNAIPAQFIRSVWSRLRETYPGSPVVCVSKGIENETNLCPSQIMADALDLEEDQFPAIALCGPTVAAELAERRPAAMVAAAYDESLTHAVQDAFAVPWLRIYRHDDLRGVELAGAVKNVIAIAAGIVDGLGVGDNAKSALLARGLAEIARLGVAMGAKVETFFGIAGVGDLATTCFSPHGRNRTCGERLGKGESLETILESMVSVVEGVPTTKSVVALAEQHEVDMPITRQVHAILFAGKLPGDAISELMSRKLKAEHIG